MNQTRATVQSAGAFSAGGALAILLLFAFKVVLPDIHAQMNEFEVQAFTLLVAWVSTRAWSLYGPQGDML
jgi:hypothetical protein